MKTQYYFTFIFLICFSTLDAQITLEIGGGPTYGKAASSLTESALSRDLEYNGINNIYLFANVGVEVFSKTEFYLGLQFVQNGYLIQSSDGSDMNTYGRRSNYIQIIPKLSYEAFNHLKLQVGPYIAFNTKEEFKFLSAEWKNYNLSTTKDVDSGLDFNIKLCISRFSLNTGMQIGLRDIQDITYTDLDGNPIKPTSSKNRLYHLGVAYRIL